MPKHKFLSLDERIQIEVNLNLGKNHEEIGKLLGRHQSTITREINKSKRGKEEYKAIRAHQRAEKRIILQRKKAPLKDTDIWEYVIT